MRTLVLTLVYPHRASYYDDWRDAFVSSQHFDCSVENILGLTPKALEAKIPDFDAIVVLHSCNSDTLDYIQPLAPALASRKRAKLLVFTGNEYNSPYVSMARRIAFLRSARSDFAATQLLPEAGLYLYGSTGSRVVSVPHALNPAVFKPGAPHARRTLDIGVKGYRYPPYLGDDDRNKLLACAAALAVRHGFRTDISEDARLSRDSWAHFLGNCRGTISTEAGSWYLDPADSLMDEIHTYLRTKDQGLVLTNDGILRRFARRLPSPMKSALWNTLRRGPIKFEMFEDFKTSFDELDALFFRNRARAPVYSKAISSRHFDAIGTKTCQILIEGRYNDILTPGIHYLPVKSDLSNIGDVLAQFRDPDLSSKIASAAYDLVMASHTYTQRAQMLHELLAQG